MNKIFITTDTHFGHSNMVQYCGRPEDFATKILKGFSVIEKGDTLIHLGDVCIGNDALWHEEIENLDCHKILVRGNHDNKSNSWYMSHGWDFVCDNFSLTVFGKDVIFSHQPVFIADHDLNIHGHFHNQLDRLKKSEWVVDGEEERNHYVLKHLTEKHINISLEETNYRPVLLSTILKE